MIDIFSIFMTFLIGFVIGFATYRPIGIILLKKYHKTIKKAEEELQKNRNSFMKEKYLSNARMVDSQGQYLCKRCKQEINGQLSNRKDNGAMAPQDLP